MDKNKPELFLNMILAETEPVEIVKRSIDSVIPYVDGAYITVTYRDSTPENSELVALLKSYDAHISYFQWIDDFAKARQYALNKVPRGDHTYIYWQDADDVLRGAKNLRKVLEEADLYRWNGVFFTYLYRVEVDKNGEPTEILIEQQRERIIRNDGTYQWKGMLHETLIGLKAENFQQHLRKECQVIHLSTDERIDEALVRNLRILEKQITEEKHKDPRTLIYLAKAYFDKGMLIYNKLQIDDKEKAIKTRDFWHEKALELFDEYLNGKGEIDDKDYIEQSGWYDERASGWQYVSQIYLLREQYQEALNAINHAIEEGPLFPQYYVDKAVIYTHLKDYKIAKHWLIIATNIEVPQTTLMVTPRDMKVRALECDAHIAMNYDRDLKRVSEDYEMLLKIAPENEVYKQNLMVADSLEAANKGMQSIVYLGKYLERIGEQEKIIPLLQAVPNDFQKEKFYAQMRHKFIPPRMWEENEIAIVCWPGAEAWTPKSIEKGIGGSEEAVIYLSQELTKLGWKVTVYANPESEEGDYNGVRYENYYKLNVEDFFSHIILWRGVGFSDINPKHRGKIILWMHDMPNIAEFTSERVKKLDAIAVLSKFHREQVKIYENDKITDIPDSKFFLTGNGIPDLGITAWKGNPHRICYVSSPDRGLRYLLRNWKTIREKVPDAELHIYYGWDVYDFLHRKNPAKIAYKKKIMELMNQEGITNHGRVSHKELAVEMNKCGVWAYPTDFTEISCISAMKAQALGAVPVVTDFAALKETVRNGYKVDVDIQEKEGQKIYVDTLVDILLHPEKQEEVRNMKWAQEYFSWEKIAQQWDAFLKGTQYKKIIQTPKEWQKLIGDKTKKGTVKKNAR